MNNNKKNLFKNISVCPIGNLTAEYLSGNAVRKGLTALAFLFYSSCSLDNNSDMIITSIDKKFSYCQYYYMYNAKNSGIKKIDSFCDSCNKFQIGDTIKFKIK